jgi:hypothetical protein
MSQRTRSLQLVVSSLQPAAGDSVSGLRDFVLL